MSPLSVVSVVALIKTVIDSWAVLFSASTATDKIQSFIKTLSFRPAGRLAWMQEVEQCTELLPRNLYALNRDKISPAGRNDIHCVYDSTFNGDIA